MFFGVDTGSEWQVDIHPSSFMVDQQVSGDIDEEDRQALERAYAQLEAVHSTIKWKKQTRFDGVEIPANKGVTGPTRPPTPGAAPKASSSKLPEGTHVESSQSTVGPSQKPSGSTSGKAPATSQPQFKYQSPMEDPAVAQRLLERLMDVQVTVSARELLSVSVDMRKLVRDLVSTKRVSVATLEAGEAPVSDLWLEYEEFIVRDDEGHVVAKTSLPLRALDGTLNDRLHVECLLDQGAQIVAIRRDLWEALGVPVRPDLATTLEAANKSKEDTLGVIENVRLKLGSMEFRLQIQVVGDAPFDLLLGHPFFALASCVTRDKISGEQSVALTDPNSRMQQLLPTRQRGRPSHEPRFIRTIDADEYHRRRNGVYLWQANPGFW